VRVEGKKVARRSDHVGVWLRRGVVVGAAETSPVSDVAFEKKGGLTWRCRTS
jgi:hypothetical protein